MDLKRFEKVLTTAGYDIDGGNSRHGSLGGITEGAAEVWLLVDGVPFMITKSLKEDKPIDINKYFNYYKG